MTDNDLNEQVEVTVEDADVITVPIDATLSNSNEAADAKAVGDALALKADKSELQAAVKVNNQPADAQGLILIDGSDIPVSDEDTETLAEAVTGLKGQTAESIPMSSDSGAKTIAEVVNANAEAIENMEEMTGATMPMEPGSQTTVKAAIDARAKTVNRQAPDIDGNIDLSVIPLAENLQSDKMQSVDGSFIIRTTGGSSSVSDGKAYPQHILGTVEHDGYVAESLNMTVIPITRTEPDEPITATIDRDTFVAYVDESGTINLYYTTEWSADPELYGITVTGTPVAGDQITVVYVKEVRGEIKVADPDRLIGTGWNLFNYNQGYARVVKYSTEYGYKIGGTYTSLAFSATLTGERSSITPGADGIFNVTSDGYVFVTGGNNTDTYILATWSDWTEGPASGYWEPYRESGVDLSYIMSTYFPYGLLAVGTTRDEIDLAAKRAISRIERKAYSEENRAAAAATGRGYSFDENNVYIVRESPVLNAITLEGEYTVSEHGLEWFTETVMPLITEILYGKNLRDKLERDVLTISAQTLTEEEKAQARTNIGAMSQADGNKKLVAPTTAGTNGQLLQTNGDGTTKWTTQGTPTDAQVGTAVSAWLTAHPEATTTVQDGAISRAKLNDDLKEKTDAVPELKSAINSVEDAITDDIISTDWESGGINGSTGANSSSNTRIRLKNKIDFSQGIEGVKSLTGYDFAVYAWNKSNGNFVGAYISTGVFATSGTIVFVSEFKFASYPDYSFKIVLRNANSPSSAITTSAGSNAIFKKISFLTATDKTELENQIDTKTSSIEDIITDETTLSDWEVGGITLSDGSDSSSNIRLRLKNKIGISTGIEKLRSLTGYDFAVYAWDKTSGNYVGAYLDNGTFNTSGTVVFITNFNFAQYPNYLFKIVLRNSVSPSSTITTSAGSNAIFSKIIFLTERDKLELEAEISSIEDIFTDEKTFSDWEVGSISVADGSDASSNIRLRLKDKVGISTYVESVRTLTGYDVAVYAWNKTTGSYVGAYLTNGTFATSGTIAFVTKFNFAQYPNYIFKLALRYNVNPNAQITTDAAVNALFKNVSVLTNDALEKLSGTRQCVICFTFDDGLQQDWDVKHLFQEKGRVCGFALKSDVTQSQITSYLGYQSDGFEILSHSTGNATPTTEPPLRLSATILRSYGFKVRGWVTPASYLNTALRRHLRKYYEFAYTELYGEHSDPTVDPSNQLTNSEYNLQRVSMELTQTYELLTNAVDNAIASGGFLTFSGHSSHLDVEGYGAFTTENLTNLIDYIKTKEADGYCRLLAPSDCYDAYFKFRHDDLWLMMN